MKNCDIFLFLLKHRLWALIRAASDNLGFGEDEENDVHVHPCQPPV